MASKVTGFGWVLECEVHVLSGMTTRPLLDFLMVTIDGDQVALLGNPRSSLPPSVGYRNHRLNPIFRRISPDTTTAQGTTLVHGNGVDFELETGRVTALPVPAGKRRMRNFLVVAVLEVVELVKDAEEMPIGDDQSVVGDLAVVGESTGGGTGSGSGSSGTGTTASGVRTATAFIRVHVHDRIQSWWPTPEKLRIASGSAGASPRLLAAFDDGTVADITEWPLVIDGLTLGWTSADPARVSVDATTGRLRSSSAPSVPTRFVDVRATLSHPALPAAFAPSAPVRAHVVADWNQPRPVSFVAGPGPRRFETATNILFLADGFVAGEEALFRELVARLAYTVVSREDAQPFKLLRESINFWSLFLASEESGATLLSEHTAPPGGAPFKLDEVPDANLAHPAGAPTLERLIVHFGLPAPADFNAGESDVVASARLIPLLTVDYELPNSFAIDLALFAAWRGLAGRSLVESRDTIFAVQAGRRPFVGRGSSTPPSLDDRRISDADIAALVGALYIDVRDGGTSRRLPVGQVWQRPSGSRRGKDAGLVCVVSRASAFGAVTETDRDRHPCHVLAHLWRYNGTDHELAARQAARPTFVLRPSAVDPSHGETPNIVLPIVHELGHVFGLEDEYGGKRPKAPVLSAGYPNGQWRDELFIRAGDRPDPYVPATSRPPGQRLSPAKIIWARWPRVRAAGELAAAPAIDGSRLRVLLRAGHERGFAVDQYVKLRRRALIDMGGTRTSPAMRVLEIVGSEVRLEVAPGFTAADALDFDVVAGSPAPLLILPLRRPGTEPPSEREQRLVAPEILHHIGESGGPLNAAANDPLWPCTKAATPVAVQFPANLPATLTRTPAMNGALFRWPNVVGLYQGGLGVDCGAYHPAGDCMMRGVNDETGSDRSSAMVTAEFRPFCHVCRYWLVDRIDPTKHRELDDLYDPSYPGPRPYE